MQTLASIAVTGSGRRRTPMHAQCRRTAAFVTTLMLLAPAAMAADKPARTSGPTTTVSATVGSEAKVNINTAGVKELTTLRGLGPKIAERIVAYREANGPFKKPEDLRKVEGVGKGLWERNRERIVTK
jgi:competence protein ComEA